MWKSLTSAACLLLATVLSTMQVSAEEVIRIGAPLPLTGALSPEGLKQQRGYDIWAKTANKAGGINVAGTRYKVEVVYNDYESNTSRAVQSTERLITRDKVNFVFSPYASGATKAASSLSERYEIPTISAMASSPTVYDQGYKYLFGMLSPNDSVAAAMADIISKSGEVKTIAIYARNDLFPLALAEAMRDSAKAKGMQVTLFENYSSGTMEHAPALTVMRQSPPDWIFATGYINDLILVRKQMADFHLQPKVLTMIAAPAYQEFINAVGPLAENISSSVWWHPALEYKGNDVFGSTANYVSAFMAEYGAVPDYAEAASSAAGVALQLAIEAAKSIKPQAVREALAHLDATTFYGPIRFSSNGQINSLQPPVFQIQGGKAVIVYPAAVRQGDLHYQVSGSADRQVKKSP